MKRFSSELFSRMSPTLLLVKKNSALFFGNTLFLLGVFGFSNGKYCDGNAADYYACTNPAAYYYYGPIALLAIVFGSFFATLWFLKKSDVK